MEMKALQVGNRLGTGRTMGVQLSQRAVGTAVGKGTVWVDRDGRAVPYSLEGRAKRRGKGGSVSIRTPNMNNLVKSGQENEAERRRGWP